MFEKLVKIHVMQSCIFFIAACGAAAPACMWMGMSLNDSSPRPFDFAPSIVFFTVAFLVLTKGLSVVINRPLRDPESTLLMTLPVSEEVQICSKVFVGTLSGFIFWMILLSQWVSWLVKGNNIAAQIINLSITFIDLDYSAWVASVSIGLIPVLLLLELIVLCLLMLLTTLVLRNRRPMQKLISSVYLLFVMGQLGFNLWLTMNYKTFIGRIHPLVLEAGLLVLLVVLAILLYRMCVKHLRYKYED